MEVLVDRGAGIDVHQKSVTVCVMTSEGRKVVKTLQRFLTFHRGLMEMRDALLQAGVTHVAMEATGEYWKPVYEVLEGFFQLAVANAQHVKNVPGRKTDPEDAAWLARLLPSAWASARKLYPEPADPRSSGPDAHEAKDHRDERSRREPCAKGSGSLRYQVDCRGERCVRDDGPRDSP